jgi:hypothetical protein
LLITGVVASGAIIYKLGAIRSPPEHDYEDPPQGASEDLFSGNQPDDIRKATRMNRSARSCPVAA